LKPGDLLEVHCTDPLSVIDIPNLIRETGDKVKITQRAEGQIVFLIEKTTGLPAAVTGSMRNQDS
jgi:tRNA 2-thiouridine synthesizing protein A